MKTVDLIISWPLHLDYPLWRKFIHENRSRFEKVIVVFTQMNTDKNYYQWLRNELSREGIITLLNNEVQARDDWRNIAVNKGLQESDSYWVWFTEQDFFPQEAFWTMVECAADKDKSDVIGVVQEKRLHPCCIFVKRSFINKTTRDFSAHPPEYDHFGKFQLDLAKLTTKQTYIESDWRHYNGLSQNMYLLQIGEQPNYEPEKFKDYCRKCLEIDSIHPEIKEVLENYVK